MLDSSYVVVVKQATAEDPNWHQVVAALQKKYDAPVIMYRASVDESLEGLRRRFPRYVCFVTRPEDAGRAFVAQVHRLTRKLDGDPYTDVFWGILTGYDARNALAIATYDKPLVVKNVASGTEFATEMVVEGEWYDELVKNKHVKKGHDGKTLTLKGPDDTTKALVDLLNSCKPDLMITSGHASEDLWQIGFRYRNGTFRCRDGQMYGQDLQGKQFPIESPNAKVYMPIGNCLLGHIKNRDSMALAWMNSVGVKQMLGYTIPTGYGYGGWGCLDYFVEQPGRYTFAEAFFANDHALIHRMNDSATGSTDRLRLGGDRDAVAFYGDPKWSTKMADLPNFYNQKLEIKNGVYSLTITPNRGEDSFKPVNTNGSQRGGRPIIQFLPHRIQNVEIVAGRDLRPVVTDDFILVPNPHVCDPTRKYVVRFKAQPKAFKSENKLGGRTIPDPDMALNSSA